PAGALRDAHPERYRGADAGRARALPPGARTPGARAGDAPGAPHRHLGRASRTRGSGPARALRSPRRAPRAARAGDRPTHGALRRGRRDPLPLLLLAPTQFALSACASVMTAVDHKLRRGAGLAVVDRIPVERFSVEENRALYWLLGSLLGRPVAQKWDGTMIYDVRDT